MDKLTIQKFCDCLAKEDNNTDEYLRILSQLSIELCVALKISSSHKSDNAKKMVNNLYLYSKEVNDALNDLNTAVDNDDVERYRKYLRLKLTQLLDSLKQFDNLFGWNEFTQWVKNERSGKFAEFIKSIYCLKNKINSEENHEINYKNQANNITMVNSQSQIFSDLDQEDTIKLESSLNQIFLDIDSIGGRKSLISNSGVDSYFIGNLDFNLNITEFVTILVDKFKKYKILSQKPDYHPLISFLSYLIKEQRKYNFDDQELAIFDKVIGFGKKKIQVFKTENTELKSNLVISKIGNSEPVIGIITALEKEYVAVQAVFENGRNEKKKGAGAGRRYWLTDIGDSEGTPQTVAVTLADMGNNAATFRASKMLDHYPTVKSIIMCGIAGGVPHPTKVEDHVRLGDIVISNKKGIVQYDFDKESQQFTEIRAMPVPASAELIEAARYLRSNEMLGQRPWEDFILKALQKLNWQRPSQETDLLHSSVQPDEIIYHPDDPERRENQPRIFLGAIGSANKLLKNPQKRDLLREQFGVKAIEMEGSGVADATWNHGIGYLVVRSICDYCDEHKSDTWQQYAAITAAAYVRTLLSSI